MTGYARFFVTWATPETKCGPEGPRFALRLRKAQKNCQVPESGCCSTPGVLQLQTPDGNTFCRRDTCAGVMSDG